MTGIASGNEGTEEVAIVFGLGEIAANGCDTGFGIFVDATGAGRSGVTGNGIDFATGFGGEGELGIVSVGSRTSGGRSSGSMGVDGAGGVA